MSTYIDSIKDKDGNTVLPLSNPKAVYFDNGERLDNVIKDINADILMLGWEVPKEFAIQNYIDENRVYHQRVGRVDLGSLDWIYDNSYNFFFSNDVNITTRNFFSCQYALRNGNGSMQGIQNDTTSDKWIATNNADMASGYIGKLKCCIRNSSYTDATTFKSAMQGVYLYYELATEITKNVDGNEVLGNNYSFDEHIVGTWIDGKPLYEKIIDCGELPNNSTKYTPHNINNLKRVISIDGVASFGQEQYMPLPYIETAGINYCVQVVIVGENIKTKTSANYNGWNVIVTIRYTKTTD